MPLRRFPLLALALASSTAFSQSAAAAADTSVASPSPLPASISALLQEPAASRAHWGIAVTRLDGTPVFELDATKLFRPASTAKLFTTAAATALLGPGATVKTRLTYTGTISPEGTLDGYLTLYGAGDDNFAGATPHSPGGDPLAVLDDFASAVGQKGIRHVTGGVMVSTWPWQPYPDGWSIEDQLWGYGAPVSGLILNDNTVRLTVQPGPHAGDPATATLLPQVTRERVLVDVRTVPTQAQAGVNIQRSPVDINLLSVTGTVALGKPVSENIAVADPNTFVESAFLDRLAAHGVTAEFREPGWTSSSDTRSFSATVAEPLHLSSAPSTTDAASAVTLPDLPVPLPCADSCIPLAEHVSAPLADDITLTLKVSQNLHAEVMLRRLAASFGREVSTAQGERVVRQFLLDVSLDPKEVLLFDGSGLSTRDLVSPHAEAQLLAYAAKQPWFPQWKAALPVAGVDGTLASRFTQSPLKGHLFAKTGTLGESRALAGYLQCATGQQLIVAIMVDNHDPTTSADRSIMDRIVEAIAATN